MKLYTEAEIISAYENAELCHLRLESFIELMTPIKLPSDEEIDDECKIGGMDTNQQLCFQLGAKWMRDQIQGGDK